MNDDLGVNRRYQKVVLVFGSNSALVRYSKKVELVIVRSDPRCIVRHLNVTMHRPNARGKARFRQ